MNEHSEKTLWAKDEFKWSTFPLMAKPTKVALNPAGAPGWLFKVSDKNGHTVQFCRSTVFCARLCLQYASDQGYGVYTRVYIDLDEGPFHEGPTWEIAMKLDTLFPLGCFPEDPEQMRD